MNIYKMFEIDGYINYEVNKKEQNSSKVDNNVLNEPNNFYLWRKNDLREDWKFRRELFKTSKQ